jgi:hypothetical protein
MNKHSKNCRQKELKIRRIEATDDRLNETAQAGAVLFRLWYQPSVDLFRPAFQDEGSIPHGLQPPTGLKPAFTTS